MDKVLEYKGVKMFYTVEGEGSTVVLMHGWGCTHETVKSIADVCKHTHRVISVDFPGFGKSSEPRQVWGVEDYAELIGHLIEVEHAENPILIGHSFGGRVAIVLGSRSGVNKIVLVDSAGVKPRRSLRYYFKVYSFKTAKWFVNLLYSKEKAAKKIDAMRGRRGSSDYAGASSQMRAIMSRVVNEDLCHLMPEIKAPTLLIWGKNDTATPLADAQKMERLIPDAGLVAFEGCGHYCFLENPGGFAAVLKSFIN